MEWKHTDSQVKKKFQEQQLMQKVMQTVLWDMERPIKFI